jgi:hypothetical protein
MTPNSNISGGTKKHRTDNTKIKKTQKKHLTRIGKTQNRPVGRFSNRSVFGLLKTDGFWFRSRFPAGLYLYVTLTRPREKAEGRKKETSPQREGGRMEGRKKGAGKQKGKVKQTEKLSS